MTKLFSTLLLLIAFNQALAWRFFYNGRRMGGNLVPPNGDDNLLSKQVFELWFTQNLDHSNPNNQQTWQQRYFVNEQFFNTETRNVVFLRIGGESEAAASWMTQGAWIDSAKKFNALCFQLEHRYYGRSIPTKDLSRENLRYLTSQQALADLAVFIKAMNVKYSLASDVKWIAFGASYAASLAAWMRLKYPHLLHGAVSSSGPLLAKVDNWEYFKVVEDDLRLISEECVKAVKLGISQFDDLSRTTVGQNNLNKQFSLCDPLEARINNSADVSNLFQLLAGKFAGIAQYNKVNVPSNFFTSNITLDTLCNIMTNKSGPEITRLAAVNSLILNARNLPCLDYKYDSVIEYLRDSSLDNAAEGGRQWTYQTCTEFGLYQTSTTESRTFGDKFSKDFFIQRCIDIFGPKYNATFLERAVERTNTLYGALDIEVSNVVFVQGSIDPWHALGITKTLSKGSPAIYINGTSHCANIYPPRESDLPQLKAARVQIEQLIGSWLDL